MPFGTETDLLVLNTCSVTEHAEKDCRYAIRKTLRHSPDAFVAVTGCYAQTGAERLRSVPGIDLLVGTQYKMHLADYLPAPTALRKRPAPEVLYTRSIDREDFTLPGTAYSDSTRALLKVQDGCNFMCSFCIIPSARGRERSRRFGDLVREAEALAEAGHQELVLTGVNIGRYAYQGATLLDVIRRLEAVPGIARIRISSIEPTTVSDDLLIHMAESSKLCAFLHVPLQSGDDRILEAMHRRYKADDYRWLIEKALRWIPELGLGTDLMVGFPGEDEQAFDATVSLVETLPFSYFHVFSYSPRPGTTAPKLLNPVDSGVIARRSRALAALSSRKAAAFHRASIGRTLPVLFEKSLKNGRRSGTTGNFLRVSVPADQAPPNSIRDTVITGYIDGTALGEVSSCGTTPLPMIR